MAARDLALVFKAQNETRAAFAQVDQSLSNIDRKAQSVGGSGIANLDAGLAKINPTALLAAAGLASVAAAGAALASRAYELGVAFDDAYDRIRIGTGATGAQLASLKQTFRDVVTDVPTDFAKASTAIADLNTRTGQTGDGLRQLAGQMLELSRLTGTDVAGNVRAATRAFGDWGVSVDEQSLVLDKFFVASQASGAGVTELMNNVVQFGAPLRQLGFSLDEAIATFAKFEREGVNTETVMGTMRIALAKLAEAGIDPKEGFWDLIRTIEAMEDPIEATQFAMDVFGKRGGADMAAAIREGRFALDDYIDVIEDVGGAIQETAIDTEDAQERMTKASAALAVAFAPIGEAALDVASTVAGAMADIITSVRNAAAAISSATLDRQAPERLGSQAAGLMHDPEGIAGFSGRGIQVETGGSVEEQERTAEAAGREAGRRVRGSYNEGLRSALREPDPVRTGRGGGARGAAAAAAKEAVQTAIDGFMQGLNEQAANFDTLFGPIGGKAASALATALEQNSASSGRQVAGALETMVKAMRDAGIEDWRQMGDDLAEAFHDALIGRTPEVRAAAEEMIGSATTAIREAQFWSAVSKEAERMGDQINVAVENAQAQITTALEKMDEALTTTVDEFDFQKRVAALREQIDAEIKALTTSLNDAQTNLGRDREDSGVNTGRERQIEDVNRSRADARSRIEEDHTKRLADIRRKTSGEQQREAVAEESRRYKEAVANFARQVATEDAARERQWGREDEDRNLRRGYQDEDAQTRANNEQLIADTRKRLETEAEISAEQLQKRAHERQLQQIRDRATDQINSIQASLDTTVTNLETRFDTFWTEQEAKFQIIRPQADAVFDGMLEDAEKILDVMEQIAAATAPPAEEDGGLPGGGLAPGTAHGGAPQGFPGGTGGGGFTPGGPDPFWTPSLAAGGTALMATVHGGERITRPGEAAAASSQILVEIKAPIYGVDHLERTIQSIWSETVRNGGFRGMR